MFDLLLLNISVSVHFILSLKILLLHAHFVIFHCSLLTTVTNFHDKWGGKSDAYFLMMMT